MKTFGNEETTMLLETFVRFERKVKLEDYYRDCAAVYGLKPAHGSVLFHRYNLDLQIVLFIYSSVY